MYLILRIAAEIYDFEDEAVGATLYSLQDTTQNSINTITGSMATAT